MKGIISMVRLGISFLLLVLIADLELMQAFKTYHGSLRYTYLRSTNLPVNNDIDQSINTNDVPVKRWIRRPPSPSTMGKIWSGITLDSNHIHSSSLKSWHNATLRARIRPVTPVDEQTRYEAYNRLRQRMFELVRGEKCDSRRGWIRAYERWQYNSKTYEWGEYLNSISETEKSSLEFLDPLLPSIAINNPAQHSLFENLCKLDGMSIDGARRISTKIQGDSAKLSEALYKRMIVSKKKEMESLESWNNLTIENKESEGLSGHPLYPVIVTSNQYNGDLSLRLKDEGKDSYSKQFRVFTVSAAHADKLYKLWLCAQVPSNEYAIVLISVEIK
jgi:hypothetical protein